MAILLTLVIVKGADLIADGLVHPIIQLEKNAYVVPGVASTSIDDTDASSQETLEPIEPLLASANVENGKSVAKKCLQCHTLEQGGKAKTGPNLWNIVGRPSGSVEGYAYSSALKQYNQPWTPEHLNAYLHKPRDAVPGTKMSFAGLKKAQDRADLVAYLQTLR